MWPECRIGNLTISPALVLAPMSGVTCSAFRRLIKFYNPGAVGLVVSEFISVEALTRQVQRSLEMMRFRPEEKPLAIQIFGYDIERMCEGARLVQGLGADIIDINCGCPAPKVVRKGGGCELMRQPQHLARLLKAVRQAVSLPLTLKLRAGYDAGCKNAVEVAKIAESEGLDAVTIHGRTRCQMYRGEVDWELIWRAAGELRIPVFGSGDIVDCQSADRALGWPAPGRIDRDGKNTLAGLYIGRAVLSNPWVFSEIAVSSVSAGKRSEGLVLNLLQRYVSLLEEDLPPKACIGRMKQLISRCARGFIWRKPMLMARSWEGLCSMLKEREEVLR